MMLSFGFLVLIVAGLIGLAMLGAGVFLVWQGSEGPRRPVGIILLVLGLLLMCLLIGVGIVYFLLPMRM